MLKFGLQNQYFILNYYNINFFNQMIEISFFIYFVGIITLLVNRNHIMIVLLRFEFIYLGIFLIIILSIMFINFIKVILYLIIIVCEARLGLRMLVLINYFYGNDKLLRIVLLKC